MNSNFDFYQAEIEYRSDKLRRDIARRRRTRVPFIRKQTQTNRTS